MKRATGDRPDHPSASRIETMTRLKEQIARQAYQVDAQAVAREILFKLRVINISRKAMLAELAQGADLPSGHLRPGVAPGPDSRGSCGRAAGRKESVAKLVEARGVAFGPVRGAEHDPLALQDGPDPGQRSPAPRHRIARQVETVGGRATNSS